jgi:hypothetical protein
MVFTAAGVVEKWPRKRLRHIMVIVPGVFVKYAANLIRVMFAKPDFV